MNGNRAKAGFTLLEVLVASTIITIMAAIGFVSLASYQRSMERFELDNTAKELFIAAQNHLLTADSMGLIDAMDNAGTQEESSDDGAAEDVYYFVYTGDEFASDSDNPESVLDLMLPYASIEETVRTTVGSYVIRYQKSSALVLDVFFAKRSGKYPHTFSSDEYETLLSGYAGDDATSARESYGDDKAVIGWYGGGAAEAGNDLSSLSLTAHNEDMLWVEVENPNVDDNGDSTCSVKLVVTGKKSGAMKTLELVDNDLNTDTNYVIYESSSGTLSVVIDDVTINKGISTYDRTFSNLFEDADKNEFIPGEDLTFRAKAQYPDSVGAVVYSNTDYANSLFASMSKASSTDQPATARIRSFRHLENLDTNVSGMNVSDLSASYSGTGIAAVQGANLNWDKFCEEIQTLNRNEADVSVWYTSQSTRTSTSANTYYPVSPTYALSYDGQDHTVSNVAVSTDTAAGLFGTLDQSGESVENLKLVDFDVVSSGGAAGALAGEVSGGVTVSNVAAYNSGSSITNTTSAVTGATAAGGLVGSSSGASISGAAAAMYVETTGEQGAAGGLVGMSSGDAIGTSYAGGHLIVKESTSGQLNKVTYSTSGGNVTASGTSGIAGGLVGTASGSDIGNSYSTCSAFGAGTAGGFVGTIANGSVSNCYVTGLVGSETGTADLDSVTLGAFAGTVSGTTFSNAYYLGVTNELNDVKAVSTDTDSATTSGIVEADASTAGFQAIASSSGTATPYVAVLKQYYNGKYAFKTADELAGTSSSTASSVHYGDWPKPDTLVINT